MRSICDPGPCPSVHLHLAPATARNPFEGAPSEIVVRRRRATPRRCRSSATRFAARLLADRSSSRHLVRGRCRVMILISSSWSLRSRSILGLFDRASRDRPSRRRGGRRPGPRSRCPSLTGRYAQRGVAHVAGLLAEDGAQQALLGRELGLALRRDLADQDVILPSLPHRSARCPDSSRSFRSASSPTFGMSRVISSRPELGIPGDALELLDVDRGEVSRRLNHASPR